MFSRRKEPSSLLRTAEGTVTVTPRGESQKHAAPNDPAMDAATSFTSDLIVEGHRGVGNPLAVDAVQDSAHDGEAHHAEDGLHTASSRVTPSTTDSICRASRMELLPPVSGCCAPP